MNESTSPIAGVLIIGNEVLSGRTQDTNLNYIAQQLTKIGIRLAEARVVPDVEQEIVDAVNHMRARYTHIFTTGGIGPTHDDITVDSIAKAFGVQVVEHPEARAKLTAQYGADKLTDARLRMARIPVGATLIHNPVSAAPGFILGNVHVMAGVPNIMRAMLDGIVPTLKPGPSILSKTVSGYVGESVVAVELEQIAKSYPQLDIGSYPWVRDGRFGTALVTRGTDKAAVEAADAAIHTLMCKFDPDSVRE